MNRPNFKPLTDRQINELMYIADLEDDMETRDYSPYGDHAKVVRAADAAYIEKVTNAYKTGSRVWS